MSSTLEDIKELARTYADARVDLGRQVKRYDKELARLNAKHADGIVALAKAAGRAKADLTTAVEGAPELFCKPKTIELHGITVGFRKKVGKITIPDTAATVALIRKHLKTRAESLIKTTDRVVVKALGNLSTSQLRKIGASTTDASDEVVVKVSETAMEKTVALFMEAQTDE